MGMPANAGLEYWQNVLVAGGSTVIPRWTLEPVPGVGECTVTIPQDAVPPLREPDVSSGAVLLAAHAVVLAALSGERDVVTGYVAAGGRVLPCRLTTDPGPWRSVVGEAARAEHDLLTHADVEVEDLRRRLGVAGPSFTTMFDPAGDGDLAADAVLRVGVVDAAGGPALLLRYRTDVLDGEAAARIAGYHLTALTLIAADPDADHHGQTLLSGEELRFQLEGLAGPHQPLPDRRFHELFEDRVAAHPDAVAAVHAGREWSYRELNARANRLGRALLARGLQREDVVAVVTERNLDWMASVLAVFKAGGVYLPIEPHFPADRIAKTLTRSECRLVLTETGSTTTLDKAMDSVPEARLLLVDDAYEEFQAADDHADGNLGVAVGADQLAYIYFTSGSTGEPKGAMCEQAGMLNHLQAKIHDLGVGEGAVVAQIAPQCFDISLWQLVSALLVGGRTLLVEQEVILDVERFVDTITAGRANVVQVVPSYLEAVLSYLEQHPRDLPDLTCVSATGEALKMELVQRFFAARPGTMLVNAYGLTETSDDTNHEVMRRAPEGDRVPLGPAVQNVAVYVVDENLVPVPLGAPGLICFSGVCVGRGYVNDPERTRAVYLSDPHRSGTRLYKGGDYGRWLPEGKLEFLGRRDSQVKISGFRIEIGEIDNALLKVPGVDDAAVVVAERPDRGKYLVAFYSGAQAIEVEVLREWLGRSLPHYMVPVSFHRRSKLPLTANGKIDAKALTALATELEVVEEAGDPPRTPAEQRVAAAYAGVLGVAEDQIGRLDHFFDRGGSSLSAVKLAIALKKTVSLKDITRYPVLADLAALIDGRAAADAGNGPGSGDGVAEVRAGLLQVLAEPDGVPASALICFPYAGGNAVNFEPMARALRRGGMAVYAVELPGHDLAAEREPFASVEQVVGQVVEQVVEEVARRGATDVLLWGHSSGTALAVATARALEERGVPVRRVFLGAQLLGDADRRRAAVAELSGLTDTDIAARLATDGGYTALGELDAQRAGHVGAAYRHDCTSAHRFFLDALETPPATKLAAPVTVVVAADDPSTADHARRHGEWRLLTDEVDLRQLADGGHYFLRTRPAQAAEAVLQAAALSPSFA